MATTFDFSGDNQKQPIRFVRRRRNASLAVEYLKQSGLKPDDTIYTRRMARVIVDSGLAHKWNLTSNPGDEFGLQRALGDLIGGHGLHLIRISTGQYRMPKELPETKGDLIIKDAVY